MSRPPTLLGGGSAHVPGTSSLINSICKIGEIVKRFAAMNVQFTDNSKEVLEAMQQAAVRALEKCGLTAEGYAKKLCEGFKHPTGNLRNSITHTVDEEEPAAYIGSNVEYAAYVELGTGKYVSGGRPTPWVYQDEKGNWHRTNGQKAQPYLKPAVADHANTYRKIIEDELKG